MGLVECFGCAVEVVSVELAEVASVGRFGAGVPKYVLDVPEVEQVPSVGSAGAVQEVGASAAKVVYGDVA